VTSKRCSAPHESRCAQRDSSAVRPQPWLHDLEHERQRGLGKVYQLFGDSPNATIEELNETLAA
jgi:hypothetical protein